jgi:hypothetical protein
MKKNILIVALLIVVAVTWWVLGHRARLEPTTAIRESTTKPATVQASGAQDRSAPSAPSAAPVPGQEIPTAQQRKWQETLRELDNTPMNLFGIVLDEQDRPIPDANVEVSWNPLQGDTVRVQLKSGADGKFAFTGHKGRYVTVNVSKEGYYVVLGESSRLPFNFAALPGQKAYKSDPNQPEVFRLRKKGTIATLVHHHLDLDIPPDGKVRVDIMSGRVAPEGEFEFALEKSQKRPPFAWQARFKIAGGGFVKAEGQFPFEAPADDYQEQLERSFPLNEQGGQMRIDFEETYFVAFGNPRKYARMKIWPKADSEVLILDWFVNPMGERNLEGESK